MKWYKLLFPVFLIVVVLYSMFMSSLAPPPTFEPGDRVFVYDQRMYGNISTVYDYTISNNKRIQSLDIVYDDGHSQQRSFGGIIKLNESMYLNISEFPAYPLSIRWQYRESFRGYHAHPPIRDIKSYCEEVYGVYKDRFTCRKITKEEIIDFPVRVSDVHVWKIQEMLDNATMRQIRKYRKASQEYHNYSNIEYSLLRDWMEFYNLTYNNSSLNINDFNEIKNNTIFMTEYCSVYGYAGYDIERGCYRVY